MSSRRLISKKNLLDTWGDTILHEWSTSNNPQTLSIMKADITDNVRVSAVVVRDDPIVISASLKNLIDRDYVSEVYISYEAGSLESDSVTYLWDKNENHPWYTDGTAIRLD